MSGNAITTPFKACFDFQFKYQHNLLLKNHKANSSRGNYHTLVKKIKLQITELSFEIMLVDSGEFIFKLISLYLETHPTNSFLTKSPEVNTTKNSAFKTCLQKEI